jgi:hypothetical protein
VLLAERFRQAVALLCVDVPDANGHRRRTPAGTVFFVGVPVTEHECQVYMVTARHVVVAAQHFGNLWLRVNLKPEAVAPGEAGFGDIDITSFPWNEHSETDVAAATIGTVPPEVEWAFLFHHDIARIDYLTRHDIGVGDEVFFPGLFSPLPGRGRFQPIVRFGRIAMMPDEKVVVRISPREPVEVDAYLIEAHAWGGHSGSPVFVHGRGGEPGNGRERGEPTPALIGLVSGHVPVRTRPLRDSLDSTAESDNAGIAVVIPGQAILDLLVLEPNRRSL